MTRLNLLSLCAAACLLPSITLAADPATKPTTAPKVRTPDTASTPDDARVAMGKHQIFLDRIKDGPIDLLFLGDSITDFWPKTGEYTWLQFAKYNPADFGISGERTEAMLWRLNNGELEGIHPKVVVLMMGTNNIGQGNPDKPEWAAAGVTKIVQTLREKLPESKILLLAVFPRDGAKDRKRSDVERINEVISKLDDGQHVRFLDIGKVFLDANGEIPTDVMRDHLHPTTKGYKLWYNAISPVIDEMMK